MTTFIGRADVEAVAERVEAGPTEVLGVSCSRADISDGVTLYLFDTGVSIFHVVEALEFAYVAELARWRARSYRDVLAWASCALSTAADRHVDAGYVFSAYWLERSCWPAEQLASAVRLLSVPKVVLADPGEGSIGAAEAVEEGLLRDGRLDDDRIVDFSLTGISIGAASWSAVAYHPRVPSRALRVEDLVEAELLTQSVWAFCRDLLDRIEAGQEPGLDVAATRRYLRAMRSRVMSPRAQESGQSLAMRRAVVTTSHLDDQIGVVLSCL